MKVNTKSRESMKTQLSGYDCVRKSIGLRCILTAACCFTTSLWRSHCIESVSIILCVCTSVYYSSDDDVFWQYPAVLVSSCGFDKVSSLSLLCVYTVVRGCECFWLPAVWRPSCAIIQFSLPMSLSLSVSSSSVQATWNTEARWLTRISANKFQQ